MAAAQSISKSSLHRLGECLTLAMEKEAVARDPNGALASAVREYRDNSGRAIPPEHLNHLVYAYNNGETARRAVSDMGVLEKAASFPLADLPGLQKLAYPDRFGGGEPTTKRASCADGEVHPMYSVPPAGMKKRAFRSGTHEIRASLPPDAPTLPDVAERDAIKGGLHRRRNLDEFTHILKYARAQYVNSLDELGRMLSATNEGPRAIREAVAVYRPDLLNIVDAAIEEFPIRKRAARLKTVSPIVDWETQPYKQMLDCQEKLAGIAELIAEPVDDILADELEADSTPKDLVKSLLDQIKTGGWGGDVSKTMLGLAGGRVLSEKFVPGANDRDPDYDRDERIQRIARLKIGDPEHERKLRQIAASEAISGTLKDLSELKGYPLVEVAEAFNRLSRSSPRAATNEVVMRSVLPKELALAGRRDMFDAQELLKAEEMIRRSQGGAGGGGGGGGPSI